MRRWTSSYVNRDLVHPVRYGVNRRYNLRWCNSNPTHHIKNNEKPAGEVVRSRNCGDCLYIFSAFAGRGSCERFRRFFRQDEGLSFQDVYQEVVDLTMANIDVQARDIIRKMKKSNEAFADVEDPHDKDLLSKFTFICMLSFDIWVKKYIIENLVDDSLGEKK